MNSLDTTIVLRFLLNDIPAQTAKVNLLLANPPVYVSDVVVSEAAFVLEKAIGFDRDEVVTLLRTILAVPGLLHNDHILPDVLNLFESKKKLSFVDCYAAVEAGVFFTTLYTFDKDLLKHGGPHVQSP